MDAETFPNPFTALDPFGLSAHLIGTRFKHDIQQRIFIRSGGININLSLALETSADRLPCRARLTPFFRAISATTSFTRPPLTAFVPADMTLMRLSDPGRYCAKGNG